MNFSVLESVKGTSHLFYFPQILTHCVSLFREDFETTIALLNSGTFNKLFWL